MSSAELSHSLDTEWLDKPQFKHLRPIAAVRPHSIVNINGALAVACIRTNIECEIIISNDVYIFPYMVLIYSILAQWMSNGRWQSHIALVTWEWRANHCRLLHEYFMGPFSLSSSLSSSRWLVTTASANGYHGHRALNMVIVNDRMGRRICGNAQAQWNRQCCKVSLVRFSSSSMPIAWIAQNRTSQHVWILWAAFFSWTSH